MAKGDPSGLYQPDPIDTGATLADTIAWATREHQKIYAAFELALCRNVEFLNVAPTKLREGMTVGADGTNWNPGAGKGVYTYYSGAWNKLG